MLFRMHPIWCCFCLLSGQHCRLVCVVLYRKPTVEGGHAVRVRMAGGVCC